MSLTEEEVRHVAKLACLALSDEEAKKIKNQLSSILDYIDKLSELNTKGVVPTSHVHGVVNAFRDDVVKESLAIEALEQNSPGFRNGCYVVPKIL